MENGKRLACGSAVEDGKPIGVRRRGGGRSTVGERLEGGERRMTGVRWSDGGRLIIGERIDEGFVPASVKEADET